MFFVSTCLDWQRNEKIPHPETFSFIYALELKTEKNLFHAKLRTLSLFHLLIICKHKQTNKQTIKKYKISKHVFPYNDSLRLHPFTIRFHIGSLYYDW